MKVVPAVSAALLCVMLIMTCGQAQPDSVAAPAKTQLATVSLRLENASLAEVVKAIAQQGQVSVLLRAEVTGQIQKFAVDKLLPEAALKLLAQSSDLRLTKINDQTFILAAKSSAKPQPAPTVPAPTNSYVIRVRLGSGLTQDIQVALCGAFNVTTKLDQTQWSIKGTNKTEADKMRIDLSVERQQTTPDNFVARQSLHTHFSTLPDGQEITLGNFNGVSPVVVSVRPSAPAAK